MLVWARHDFNTTLTPLMKSKNPILEITTTAPQQQIVSHFRYFQAIIDQQIVKTSLAKTTTDFQFVDYILTFHV